MNESPQTLTPAPLPSPEASHRRQAAWQIWLPLGLLLALFIAAGVLAVLCTSGYSPQPGLPDQQSPLAKASVIMLVSGACLGSLLQLLVLIGLVLLSGKIITGLPDLSHKVQNGFTRLDNLATRASQKATAPIISLAGIKAALVTLFTRLQFWKKEQHSQ
jgi:hypothetical protein